MFEELNLIFIIKRNKFTYPAAHGWKILRNPFYDANGVIK